MFVQCPLLCTVYFLKFRSAGSNFFFVNQRCSWNVYKAALRPSSFIVNSARNFWIKLDTHLACRRITEVFRQVHSFYSQFDRPNDAIKTGFGYNPDAVKQVLSLEPSNRVIQFLTVISPAEGRTLSKIVRYLYRLDVSVVVAEIVMQNIEERAIATCRQTIPLWLRYVDDTFTAVHKDEIDDFHKHLNEQHADIQFTREIEEDGKLPFLDCLVSHDNNELRTTV